MVRIINLCKSTIAKALLVYSANTNISTATDSAYVENESAILTLYKCIIGTNSKLDIIEYGLFAFKTKSNV